jgi:hypothetical protein
MSFMIPALAKACLTVLMGLVAGAQPSGPRPAARTARKCGKKGVASRDRIIRIDENSLRYDETRLLSGSRPGRGATTEHRIPDPLRMPS